MGSSVWYLTPSDGEVLLLEIWRVWSTSSLSLLSGPPWSGVVVLVRFPSVAQIDMFNNDSYSIGPCWKKRILRNNYTKNKYEHTTALLARLRICRLYTLQRDKTPQKRWCPWYNTKLHRMLRLHFWGMWNTPSLQLFLVPLLGLHLWAK